MTFRNVSLRRLLQRLERAPGEELISLTSLTRMKNYQQPLTPEVLHALGDALDCGPEDIIGVNPMIEPEVIDLLAEIRRLRSHHNPAAIVQATQHLRAIA
jgi:hypothetical protein